MKTICYKFDYIIIIATTISNKHENYIIIRSRKVTTLSSLKYYIFISCNGYRIKDLRAIKGLRNLSITEGKMPEMKRGEEKEDIWSEWLDFNQSNITTTAIPEKPGVFKVHASMKILYIGSTSTNLKQSLLESLSDPCIGKARRFSYLVTEKAEQVKDQLLEEYRESHGGRLPTCMDK